MGTLLNADEVFAMAIQIEENGAAFYRKAAGLQTAREAIDVFASLAAMEEDHKATFESMRAAADDSSAGAPGPEGGLYMAAIADGYRLEGSPRAAESLTGSERVEDVLKTAIGLEKDAILLYLGLRDAMPEGVVRDQVEAILDQEKSHLVMLTDELKKHRG